MNGSGPVSRQSVPQREQHRTNSTGPVALAQTCYEIGTKKPFFGDGRHQKRGKSEWYLLWTLGQECEAGNQQPGPYRMMRRERGGDPLAPIEQRQEQHQVDPVVIAAEIRKSGAAREDGAADPIRLDPANVLPFSRNAGREWDARYLSRR